MKEQILTNFKWVSAKKYSQVTGMPYQQVLTLCKTGKLECVETEGGECYKQFLVKLSINGDMVPRSEHEELLAKYTKALSKIELIESILLKA